MVGPATRARPAAGGSRRAAAPPLRHRPGVAADPASGRDVSAGDLRRTLALARGSGDLRAHLSEPRRPDLCHHLQSRACLVLVPAHAARGGAGVQGVRFGDGRPRPLDGAYGVRGPDRAARCPAAREHRDPHAGVFLSRHDDPFYLILCRPAAQPLEAGAAFLRLQPALARRGGWARLAAHAGSDAGAADELDQARERVLPVARLGAVTLRIDDEHALAREPPAGEPLEPLSNLLRQIRSRDVEAQLDRGRDLVDVLAARSRGAQEALLDAALVDRNAGRDANHAGHSTRPTAFPAVRPI